MHNVSVHRIKGIVTLANGAPVYDYATDTDDLNTATTLWVRAHKDSIYLTVYDLPADKIAINLSASHMLAFPCDVPRNTASKKYWTYSQEGHINVQADAATGHIIDEIGSCVDVCGKDISRGGITLDTEIAIGHCDIMSCWDHNLVKFDAPCGWKNLAGICYPGDIHVNTPFNTETKDILLMSYSGNIEINTNITAQNVFIFAPKGTVTINANITASIANVVIFSHGITCQKGTVHAQLGHIIMNSPPSKEGVCSAYNGGIITPNYLAYKGAHVTNTSCGTDRFIVVSCDNLYQSGSGYTWHQNTLIVTENKHLILTGPKDWMDHALQHEINIIAPCDIQLPNGLVSTKDIKIIAGGKITAGGPGIISITHDDKKSGEVGLIASDNIFIDASQTTYDNQAAGVVSYSWSGSNNVFLLTGAHATIHTGDIPDENAATGLVSWGGSSNSAFIIACGHATVDTGNAPYDNAATGLVSYGWTHSSSAFIITGGSAVVNAGNVGSNAATGLVSYSWGQSSPAFIVSGGSCAVHSQDGHKNGAASGLSSYSYSRGHDSTFINACGCATIDSGSGSASGIASYSYGWGASGYPPFCDNTTVSYGHYCAGMKQQDHPKTETSYARNTSEKIASVICGHSFNLRSNAAMKGELTLVSAANIEQILDNATIIPCPTLKHTDSSRIPSAYHGLFGPLNESYYYYQQNTFSKVYDYIHTSDNFLLRLDDLLLVASEDPYILPFPTHVPKNDTSKQHWTYTHDENHTYITAYASDSAKPYVFDTATGLELDDNGQCLHPDSVSISKTVKDSMSVRKNGATLDRATAVGFCDSMTCWDDSLVVLDVPCKGVNLASVFYPGDITLDHTFDCSDKELVLMSCYGNIDINTPITAQTIYIIAPKGTVTINANITATVGSIAIFAQNIIHTSNKVTSLNGHIVASKRPHKTGMFIAEYVVAPQYIEYSSKAYDGVNFADRATDELTIDQLNSLGSITAIASGGYTARLYKDMIIITYTGNTKRNLKITGPFEWNVSNTLRRSIVIAVPGNVYLPNGLVSDGYNLGIKIMAGGKIIASSPGIISYSYNSKGPSQAGDVNLVSGRDVIIHAAKTAYNGTRGQADGLISYSSNGASSAFIMACGRSTIHSGNTGYESTTGLSSWKGKAFMVTGGNAAIYSGNTTDDSSSTGLVSFGGSAFIISGGNATVHSGHAYYGYCATGLASYDWNEEAASNPAFIMACGGCTVRSGNAAGEHATTGIVSHGAAFIIAGGNAVIQSGSALENYSATGLVSWKDNAFIITAGGITIRTGAAKYTAGLWSLEKSALAICDRALNLFGSATMIGTSTLVASNNVCAIRRSKFGHIEPIRKYKSLREHCTYKTMPTFTAKIVGQPCINYTLIAQADWLENEKDVTYTWYRYDDIVQEGTSKQFIPQHKGSYLVVVTSENGCAASPPVNVKTCLGSKKYPMRRSKNGDKCGKKRIKNTRYLTSKAKDHLYNCFSNNTCKGFNVDYVGANILLDDYESTIEVKTFTDMFKICNNINMWECMFQKMGLEKEARVLDELSHDAKCIRVKLEDIKISDFNPLNPPDFYKYEDYLTHCAIQGTGRVIPLQSSTKDPCENDDTELVT